jgi:hypothetical protein
LTADVIVVFDEALLGRALGLKAMKDYTEQKTFMSITVRARAGSSAARPHRI